MATIRSAFYAPRLSLPPATNNPALDLWLRQLADAVNTLPPLSTFSYATPESNVSAIPGTLGTNFDPTAPYHIWVKDVGSGNTGWRSPAFGSMAMGDVNFNTNAVATVITTQNTWTRVAPALTSVLSASMEFDSPTTARLRYTGTPTLTVHAGCALSIKGAGANDTFKAMLYKNGTVNANNEYTAGFQVAAGVIQFKLGAIGDVGSTAIHSMFTMATNDYVELAVMNTSDTDDCTATEVNLFAVGTM